MSETVEEAKETETVVIFPTWSFWRKIRACLRKSSVSKAKRFDFLEASSIIWRAFSFAWSETVEEAKETETVVIFPDSNDNTSSQRFADDSNND